MNPLAADRPSLTDLAYHEIKQSICLGRFNPGDKLVVEDLINLYKISNTPIKEALNRLISEGLVEAKLRRGMWVKKYSAKEIEDILEIRLMYELYCASKAMKQFQADARMLSELKRLLDDYGALVTGKKDSDYAEHLRMDEEFHLTIIRLSGNEALTKEYEKLNAIGMAFSNYARRELPLVRAKDAYAEHQMIYQAFEAGDIQNLLKCVRNHINNIARDVLSFNGDR